MVQSKEKHSKINSSPRVVVIGGGTGSFSVLSGLKKYPLDLTAIISMADNGGSTGVLREEFGILPPGDIRRALVALSEAGESLLSQLFTYRFSQGSLKGHSCGNLLLTALTEMRGGDFGMAVRDMEKILAVKGKVVPVTLMETNLYAELENGEVIAGETSIDIPQHDGHLKITKAYLQPACSINPRAQEAIQKADLIVIGPGDLYTSIIPNLLVKGVPEAIKKNLGTKVYVSNLMTKFGETNGFKGKDFVSEIEKYLGNNILDIVIFNNNYPDKERIREYEKEEAQFVSWESGNFQKSKFKIQDEDLLRKSGFIRHDPVKISRALWRILNS
jgi:uncharacterized cofD-like protein